jgi:hypothetical protein
VGSKRVKACLERFFVAGLRRGELQALRCIDVDLGGPMLAILRDYIDAHLLKTERTGKDRIFGRAVSQPFYAATIDGRAKRTLACSQHG